ncbi:hypothetical protein TNCT_99301 [Trichonephila clavata]|uniref:Uncharacterized protein n=1 Tax=Trichonephila clavata TaxID=2740835 RepID=A0A8X6M5R9_TRICU|nr:hypothetical protein TNCT_99301 [Trichonephila clavata]
MECHSEVVKALGNNALLYHPVARWVGKFQQERVSNSDEKRSRQPLSVHVPSSRSSQMKTDDGCYKS